MEKKMSTLTISLTHSLFNTDTHTNPMNIIKRCICNTVPNGRWKAFTTINANITTYR